MLRWLAVAGSRPIVDQSVVSGAPEPTCHHDDQPARCLLCAGAEPLALCEAPGLAEYRYFIGSHDLLLTHGTGPAVRMWQHVWACSLALATYILDSDWEPGAMAIDLGCGPGLTGLAALVAGLNVTFADAEPAAVELACANADRAGFGSDRCSGLIGHWRDYVGQWSHMLASDVAWSADGTAGLVEALSRLWDRRGRCLIAHPDRPGFRSFAAEARAHCLLASSETVLFAGPDGRRRAAMIEDVLAPPRGFGDIVDRWANRLGVKKLASLYERAVGRPCGCEGRRDWLNDLFPTDCGKMES